MTTRGDLLALVDGAPGELRTLQGALTTWTHRELAAEARAWAAERAGDDPGRLGDVAPLRGASWRDDGAADDDPRATTTHRPTTRPTPPGPTTPPRRRSPSRHWPPPRPGDADGAPEVLLSWYVAVAPPDRWRVVGRGQIAVSDGRRSWAGTSTLVTERDSSRAAIHDAGVIGACLYPGALLGGLELADPTPAEVEGRPCWVVDAVPRPEAFGTSLASTAAPQALRLHGDLVGIEHRLWFDAATGILLRHEGFVDGETCSTTRLTDLVVDAVPRRRPSSARRPARWCGPVTSCCATTWPRWASTPTPSTSTTRRRCGPPSAAVADGPGVPARRRRVVTIVRATVRRAVDPPSCSPRTAVAPERRDLARAAAARGPPVGMSREWAVAAGGARRRAGAAERRVRRHRDGAGVAAGGPAPAARAAVEHRCPGGAPRPRPQPLPRHHPDRHHAGRLPGLGGGRGVAGRAAGGAARLPRRRGPAGVDRRRHAACWPTSRWCSASWPPSGWPCSGPSAGRWWRPARSRSCPRSPGRSCGCCRARPTWPSGSWAATPRCSARRSPRPSCASWSARRPRSPPSSG